MRKTFEYLFTAAIGGVVYGAVETLWRGYTHPSMILVGGICFLLIYIFREKNPERRVVLCAAVGAVIITTVEFISGCILNLWLGLSVWSYRSMTPNLLGQICPHYMALWFLLSFPATYLCDVIRNFALTFHESSGGADSSSSNSSSSSP
ncbi:MAG: putative ABC transporter permease [Clostridiales bacterium]|nr:putative ABC transporter permease [Clostridiales bacterium]